MKRASLAFFAVAILSLGVLTLLSGPPSVSAQNPTPTATSQPDFLPPAIVRFAVDVQSVTLAAIEAGTALATFSWQTVGMTAQDRLVLQYFEITDWKTIAPDQVLPANGAARFALLPPLDFASPTYRLLLQNQAGQIIAQQIVTIAYDLNATLPPAIASFTTDSVSVSGGLLALGQARINVAWRIENRLPTANPEFLQVLPDGNTVSVELPRLNRWVSSSGQGLVAPVNVPGSTSIRLRMRLVDLRDGKVYQESDIILPITGAAAAPALPTVTPISAPEGTPESEPEG